MVDQTERVLDAARAIRPFLEALVPRRAGALDAALADILTTLDREQAGERVTELLVAEPATAAWMVEYVTTGLPPASALRGHELPGHGSPTRAPRFRCPSGDYLWYRRSAGLPVPLCPTHKLPLELDQR